MKQPTFTNYGDEEADPHVEAECDVCEVVVPHEELNVFGDDCEECDNIHLWKVCNSCAEKARENDD